MSVHDPASSFGAPGGAWDSAFWAEATGAKTSKSKMKVTAPLKRFILARTRSSPSDYRPDEGLRTALPLQRSTGGGRWYFARERRFLPPRRVTSRIFVRGICGMMRSPSRCRCGGVGLGLGRSLLFRREEGAWETVGGDWKGRTWRLCARSSWSARGPAAWTTTYIRSAAAPGSA